MIRAGVCPNSFTLVGVLLAAAGLGDAVLAECIHGWAVRATPTTRLFLFWRLLLEFVYQKVGSNRCVIWFCKIRSWLSLGFRWAYIANHER
jgi:hypothetical protein